MAPGDAEKKIMERVEALQRTVELLKQESSEQTKAITGLNNAIDLMREKRQWEHDEVKALLERLGREVAELAAKVQNLHDDVWKGERSMSARLKDVERDQAHFHGDWEKEWADLRQDIKEGQVDTTALEANIPAMIDAAIERKNGFYRGKTRLEHTRGFWAFAGMVIVAFLSALGLVVEKLIEIVGK